MAANLESIQRLILALHQEGDFPIDTIESFSVDEEEGQVIAQSDTRFLRVTMYGDHGFTLKLSGRDGSGWSPIRSCTLAFDDLTRNVKDALARIFP